MSNLDGGELLERALNKLDRLDDRLAVSAHDGAVYIICMGPR